MKATDLLKLPLAAAGVLGATKSFRLNPVLGSRWLNERGLHRGRVAAAASIAERRRRALGRALLPEDRAAFDRDGFLVKPDFLPRPVFDDLVEGLRREALPAREMRQGSTVTRMVALGPAVLARLPGAAAFVHDPTVVATMRYVAASGGEPVFHVQTVFAEADRGRPDPQTELHSDTFHATAKCWLFLQDVGEEDGPFAYVPGSHRLTPERLAWEHAASLSARADPRAHHAHGSFRIASGELAGLGYGPPRRVTVKANTLVYADTRGFHARSPSPRATRRIEIHGYLRGNPFLSLAALDVTRLAALRDQRLDLYLAYADRRERITGRRNVWRPVGAVRAEDPPRV